MANENNDISDMVKKCKILLLDIEGTTTSISFVKDKLYPYAAENVKDFLTNKWEDKEVKKVVEMLRKLALEDKENSVDGVVAIPGEDASKEDQIEGLVNNVKWQMSTDRKERALKELQGLIWQQGYQKGDIKGHVYDDVSPALELWRSVEGQKVYIYSSGSVEAQRLLFAQSVAGDMGYLINGYYDTACGVKQEPASYRAIAENIGCKPQDILFLTDIVKEADAARATGAHAALVSREGNAPLPAEAASSYPVLYSLATLANPNKRKPDAQDEQPAKVLKTDVDADVKTASETEVNASSDAKAPSEVKASEDKSPAETTASVETEVPAETKAAVEDNTPTETVAPKAETMPETKESTEIEAAPETITADSENPAPKTTDEPEKMDVEEEAPAVTEDKADQAKMEVVTEKVVETIVEEVTDSNEIGDTPVCDIEPVIEESSDKTETPETEKMETESSEPVLEPKESADIKNGDKDAPIPEETLPVSVITEIKDVTNEKEELNEVAEMIEDLEPIVEEPAANQDIEELQNVGEVLEKECDEILSKVQDVTNLDNIPLKPLLNTIAEETMETENLDSNDIVERILDSEMEMELKQSEEKEKALKAAEEASKSENKIVSEDDKVEKKDVANNETTTDVPEEKPTETVLEVKPTEVNVDSSNVKTTDGEENKVASEEKETKVEADSEMKETKAEADKTEQKMETEVSTETDDSKADVPEVTINKKLDTEEKKVEEVTPEPEKKEAPVEQNKENNETTVEAKESQKVPEEAKSESEPKEKEIKEAQVNGKATNGEAEVPNQNGDTSKDEELSSRLSIENGKETVNGANGDSAKEDQGKIENSTEVDVADIKVKTVAVEEPRNDPIEQPTEA